MKLQMARLTQWTNWNSLVTYIGLYMNKLSCILRLILQRRSDSRCRYIEHTLNMYILYYIYARGCLLRLQRKGTRLFCAVSFLTNDCFVLLRFDQRLVFL